MNLRDLKYLVAVAENRNFHKAAARCFVSQPTLSSQIKKLEQELGVSLFERNHRSVIITPVGEQILIHARQLLEQADLIQQTAHAHQDPLAGPLRIGAIPTLSPYLMPQTLIAMRQDYPQIRMILSEEVTDRLLARLHAGEIDGALLATPEEARDLEMVNLFEEPFWLAHPRNHPLYYQDEISRGDLEKLDLLLLADEHCLALQVMEVCHYTPRDGHEEITDLRAASLETLLQLVGAGVGCTLVPALALRGAWVTESGVIARKLELPDARRLVRLVFRRHFPRRQVLEVFAEVIRRYLPNTVKVLDSTFGS